MTCNTYMNIWISTNNAPWAVVQAGIQNTHYYTIGKQQKHHEPSPTIKALLIFPLSLQSLKYSKNYFWIHVVPHLELE